MWVSLLLFILILAIAFFQATQGLFSALLMTVIVVCCAGLAIGTHEYIAIQWLAPKWRPDYAMALSLGAAFGIPLLILRLATDQLIRRSCLLPSWVDRIGGGACGFITGLVLCGIFALCAQMLPFNGSFLGYSRIEVPVKEQVEGGPVPEPTDPEREETILLAPDRFAAALGGLLSDGLFSANRSFLAENVDYVQQVGWRGAVASEIPRYAPPKSIRVVRHETKPFVYQSTPMGRDQPPEYKEIPPKDGHEYRMVRVELKKEAMAGAKSHFFSLRQFRLVGREEGSDELSHYYPIAIQNENKEEPTTRHVRFKRHRNKDWPVIDDPMTPREGNNGEVEIVYELPRGYRAEYLEYKRGARVPLSFESGSGAAPAESAAAPSAPTPSAEATSRPPTSRTASTSGSSDGGGRVRSVAAEGDKSTFGDKLPLTMTSYIQIKDGEINHGALANGHLIGNLDDQSSNKNPAVSKFDVPDDKRLLHLSSQRLKARSTLGGALSFAVRTMQNYLVQDSSGRQYQMVGKYGVAEVDGRKVVEVQYFKDQSGTLGGVGQFQKIKDSHLTGEYTLVLLFLVEPGAKIVSFSTGAGDGRQQDLAEENLVAPN